MSERRRTWERMPVPSRVFTALLVLSMGCGSYRGHIFFIEGVHQGVLNMIVPPRR